MSQIVRRGAERVRVGPWRGSRYVAQLAPVPGSAPPSSPLVEQVLASLAEEGVSEVITAALAPGEQRGFLGAGFELREELYLLAHDLGALPDLPSVGLRRGRRSDRAAALHVDALAFEPFWRLDESGLEEALAATPSRRLRVAGVEGVAGYAVSGRAGSRGYLQRLAVHPAHRGCGLGRALTLDGLHWMQRRGVRRAMVNTQLQNEAALALYRSAGFRLQPGGLAVLSRRLVGVAPPDAPTATPGRRAP